jgi:integrase
MMSDLPANVRPVFDRHGRIRYRFRKKGYKGGYLKGKPGTEEFHRSYADLLAGKIESEIPTTLPIVARSIDDLVARWKKSVIWKKKGARTQYKQARILERFADRVDRKGRRYGERPVKDVSVVWLDNIFGMMAGTPAAANELRKILGGLMDHAVRMQWRTDNPARLTEKYEEGEGFHDVTDEEIEQYRSTHPLGTMARLTLELALNTAGRRCNLAIIEREHIKGGRIYTDHAKGNNDASVRMLATTKAAIDAMPAASIRYLITTQFGKPFSVAGLGNRARKWFDDAGLPHCSLHGLRKALSRQLAESGATDAEGKAVTGHKKDSTFAYYRAKANRTVLADRAMSNLAPLVDVQPDESDGDGVK